MSFTNEQEVSLLYKKPNYTYSEIELERFGRELEAFRVKKVDTTGQYSFIDFNKYLDSVRATINGSVIVQGLRRVVPKNKKPDEYILDCHTTNYEILMEKFEQYIEMMGRREALERRKVEGLAQVAKTLDITEM